MRATRGHLHGERAGVHAGCLAAERAALEERRAHAGAREGEGDHAAVKAAADDQGIEGVRWGSIHSGAGSGTGMSS